MKKSIANKWIKALRSGKYKQTTSVLRNLDGFCCLGVLCDISERGKWKRAKGGKVFVFNDWYDKTMPNEVIEWAGMNNGFGLLPDTSLTDLNDHEGKSFDEIADVIEKNWNVL